MKTRSVTRGKDIRQKQQVVQTTMQGKKKKKTEKITDKKTNKTDKVADAAAATPPLSRCEKAKLGRAYYKTFFVHGSEDGQLCESRLRNTKRLPAQHDKKNWDTLSCQLWLDFQCCCGGGYMQNGKRIAHDSGDNWERFCNLLEFLHEFAPLSGFGLDGPLRPNGKPWFKLNLLLLAAKQGHFDTIVPFLMSEQAQTEYGFTGFIRLFQDPDGLTELLSLLLSRVDLFTKVWLHPLFSFEHCFATDKTRFRLMRKILSTYWDEEAAQAVFTFPDFVSQFATVISSKDQRMAFYNCHDPTTGHPPCFVLNNAEQFTTFLRNADKDERRAFVHALDSTNGQNFFSFNNSLHFYCPFVSYTDKPLVVAMYAQFIQHDVPRLQLLPTSVFFLSD